jgi:hypothetical protein
MCILAGQQFWKAFAQQSKMNAQIVSCKEVSLYTCVFYSVHNGGGLPRNFVGGGVEQIYLRAEREWGSGGGSPLVRGSAQFAIK